MSATNVLGRGRGREEYGLGVRRPVVVRTGARRTLFDPMPLRPVRPLHGRVAVNYSSPVAISVSAFVTALFLALLFLLILL